MYFSNALSSRLRCQIPCTFRGRPFQRPWQWWWRWLVWYVRQWVYSCVCLLVLCRSSQLLGYCTPWWSPCGSWSRHPSQSQPFWWWSSSVPREEAARKWRSPGCSRLDKNRWASVSVRYICLIKHTKLIKEVSSYERRRLGTLLYSAQGNVTQLMILFIVSMANIRLIENKHWSLLFNLDIDASI